jgi:hypothetical protein
MAKMAGIMLRLELRAQKSHSPEKNGDLQESKANAHLSF